MAEDFTIDLKGMLGMGSGASGGGSKSASSGIVSGLLGGMKQFFGKAGVVGVLLNQSLEALKKIKDVLADSSASFAATMKIWGQAMRLFFKPFGDFLSTILRPLGIGFLKLMIKWNKWLDIQFSKSSAVKAAETRIAEKEKETGKPLTSDERVSIFQEEINKQGKASISDSFKLLKEKLSEWWKNIVGEGGLSVDFQALKDKLAGWWDMLDLSESFQALKDKLSGWWNSFDLSESFEALKDKLSEAWTGVISMKEDVWFWIKSKWVGVLDMKKDVFEWFKTKWNNFIDFKADIWEWMKEKFVGSIDMLGNVWEWIKSKFKGTLNIGQLLWNWIKDNLLSRLSFGGSSGGRADGGVVTGRRTITVGERGPEAIIPLNKMGGMGNNIRIDNINITNPNLNSNQNIENVASQVAEMIYEKIRRKTTYG